MSDVPGARQSMLAIVDAAMSHARHTLINPLSICALQTCIERDAVALDSWLSAQPGHQGTPLLVSAASLAIALEAHTLQAGGACNVNLQECHLMMHSHFLWSGISNVTVAVPFNCGSSLCHSQGRGTSASC